WSLVVGRWSKPRTTTIFSNHRSVDALANDKRPTPELFRPRLADLLLQAFAGVTHALIFVRIGRTQAAHLGGDLSNFLAIDAGDGQFGLLRINCCLNTGRQRIFNGM